MKGAFLVSDDSELYEEVRDALLRSGAAAAAGDVVQLRDEKGNLLTVYGQLPSATEWEWREGSITRRSASDAPNMATATACWVECRSEEAFSLIVRRLAHELSHPLWVLDGDGVLWPADEIDPAQVRL